MRSNYFTLKMFLRQLAPSLLAAITLAFADMADALVVGQRMGATGLAAVGLCIPFFMVINVIMHGFGIGGSVRYATLLAEGDNDTARSSFQGVLTAALLSGVVLGLLCFWGLEPLLGLLGTTPQDGVLYHTTHQYASIICLCTPIFYLTYILQYYLQNDDEESVAGWGFSVGMTVDIVSNIVLVLLLDWGICGAAVSTVLGNMVTSAIYLVVIARNHSPLYPSIFRPNYKDGIGCFLAGLSTSSRHLFTLTFLVLANRFLLIMSGEIGVAVLDVVQNASFFVYYLYEAVARSAQPLISTYCGEKNEEQLRATRRLATVVGHCFGLIGISIIVLFPHLICSMFGLHSTQELEMGRTALHLFCLGGIFGGANLLATSFAQSFNDEDTAFFLTILRGGVVLVPVTFGCVFLGLEWFWLLFPITEIVTYVLYRVRQNRQPIPHSKEQLVFSHTIGNQLEELSAVVEELEQFCDKYHTTPRQGYYLCMAVEELCTVIMNEGFQGESGLIQITLLVLADGVCELRFRDSAHAFDPFSLNSGKLDEHDCNLDALGILAIKERAKSFSYRQYQGFNTLVVRI